MTADGLIRAVRGQLGLGRLLPLGGAADGVWIAERAAAGVLREAETAVAGVRLGAVRIATAEPDAHDWGAVRRANPAAPPGALPPAPLRIEADFSVVFAATGGRPLPRTADLLRSALAGTATRRLGLAVAEIDLRVAGLLDEALPADDDREAEAGDAAPDPVADSFELDVVAVAATRVPGVSAVTSALAGLASGAARMSEPDGGSPRLVRVQIAVAAGYRALDVALAVRDAATAAALADSPGAVAVAVTVTDVVPGAGTV